MLKDIAESLNESVDISQAVNAILPRLSQVLGLSTAWAFRYDPQRSCFVEVGASGLPPALAADGGATLKSSWCECQERFVQGRLDTAVNIVRCSRLRDACGDKQGLRYHASIPLKSKNKRLGILNVAAAGHQVFTEPALTLLRTVGYQVAVAIDRSTLLADARHFSDNLQKMAELNSRLGSVLALDDILKAAAAGLALDFGYEAAGILDTRRNQVVARMHNPDAVRRAEYSYDQAPAPLLDPFERKFLQDARSGISQPVHHTPYVVRIESSLSQSLSSLDAKLLNAFSWQLSGVLDHLRVHQQSTENARWDERRQIAANLHDAVSQRLFSAQLLTQAAVRKLASSESAAGEASHLCERVEDLLAQGQREMRTLIETLRPMDSAFTERLRARLDPIAELLPTPILCEVEEAAANMLTAEQQEGLLQILDEALHNILKHAGRCTVTVRLARKAHRVLLTVRDTGCGFVPEQIPAHTGYGLQTMAERAQSISGALACDSAPGRGTVITVRLDGIER